MSNRYYQSLMILTICNGSPPLLFLAKLDITAEKTHPRVTTDTVTDQQTWKREMWKLLHTQVSL